MAEELVTWEEVDDYLATTRRGTLTLLKQYWPAVEALAQALLERRSMQRDEILVTVQPHIK